VPAADAVVVGRDPGEYCCHDPRRQRHDYVSDLQRAVEFYHGTLEFALAFRAGDHWAELDAGGGFHLGLHPVSARGRAPGARGGITVGLAVDEPIVEVVERLTRRGVIFHGPIHDDGGLKLAFFTDPDGNPLYLAETCHGEG
jgi:catechol 2,3-dioxygenase-like lactoylglutathione lyase family enzyme